MKSQHFSVSEIKVEIKKKNHYPLFSCLLKRTLTAKMKSECSLNRKIPQ